MRYPIGIEPKYPVDTAIPIKPSNSLQLCANRFAGHLHCTQHNKAAAAGSQRFGLRNGGWNIFFFDRYRQKQISLPFKLPGARLTKTTVIPQHHGVAMLG